jgi:RNAse (barnase) inhibitor barstar
MDKWESVFNSYFNSGVFVVSPLTGKSAIRKAANSHNLDFIQISTKGVTTKESFLKKLAESLDFPDYFGMNWDALIDSLTDLSWRPATGYVILFTNFPSLSKKTALDMSTARSIFESSANYWKQKKVPFFVILSE